MLRILLCILTALTVIVSTAYRFPSLHEYSDLRTRENGLFSNYSLAVCPGSAHRWMLCSLVWSWGLGRSYVDLHRGETTTNNNNRKVNVNVLAVIPLGVTM